jgi:hypothetical protein
MVNMLNINLFENIDFNCFWGGGKKQKKNRRSSLDLDKEIYKVCKQYKISILPINPLFDIDNLYPLTDHVELWNIFIVGNDKTYILANVRDIHINIPNIEELPNHKSANILPDELAKMFDTLWDKTLTGKQLQFYMVWNGKLYFINTYPFYNGARKIIGAILFMRAFETMPDMRFTMATEGTLVPQRFSEEKAPGTPLGIQHQYSQPRTSDKGDGKGGTTAEIAAALSQLFK